MRAVRKGRTVGGYRVQDVGEYLRATEDAGRGHVTNRPYQMLHFWYWGNTLAQVGRIFKMSGERVRQIGIAEMRQFRG